MGSTYKSGFDLKALAKALAEELRAAGVMGSSNVKTKVEEFDDRLTRELLAKAMVDSPHSKDKRTNLSDKTEDTKTETKTDKRILDQTINTLKDLHNE